MRRMNARLSEVSALVDRLAAALGADAVSTDTTRLDLLSRDAYRQGGLPLCTVRPGSTAALQQAVRLCAEAGAAMVPRGGGASYTDGYVYPAGGHVLFDTAGLDVIAVDETNAVVTVGAGVTWAALRARLAPLGLRTPFWGPFSGLVASIGGTVSQHAISHGSGAYGVSAPSVVSMDVVLASGELLHTGAAAATRHFGPDLTGLFCGDCGALGIKAALRLPLLAARAHFEALSFAFPGFEAFHAGLREAARAGLDDEHFGLDVALSQGQIGQQDDAGSRLRIAAAVLRSAPNPLAGVWQLLRMAAAGQRVLAGGAYMLHFIVEGSSAAEARARADSLRGIVTAHGQEIANSVPAFVRALPFAPLNNTLGPGGERWVPLHGIFPHGAVPAFHVALAKFYDKRRADMQRLGVTTGAMFCGVGSGSLLYELAIYWRDARTAFHRAVIDADSLAKLPEHAANAEAAAYVEQLKRDLIALYAEHGAAHFQIGRAYPYLPRLGAPARALVLSLKAALDPQGLMNPGALGLATTGAPVAARSAA
jgi:D-lactate dehydrogenase (cytochrome)